MVESAFPIFSTPDLSRSLDFYVDLLGAAIKYRFPDDGPPVYVGLDLGSSHLGIGEDKEFAADGPQRASLWVYVEDCDTMFDALVAAGTPVVEPPATQPWGERTASVTDPDGNVVIIGTSSD
jgi:uncharacterized glyoxalase superfamily protein PhnB